MKIITFKEYCLQQKILNEMFIYGTKASNKYVIAFRSDIFLFDETDKDKIVPEMMSKLFTSFRAVKSSFDNNINFFDDMEIIPIFDEIQEFVVDVLCGYISDETLILYGDGLRGFSPPSSILVSKVVSHLELKKVDVSEYYYDNGYNHIYKDTDLKMKIPDIGFHGTSSKYLVSILRLGIRYDQSEKNWHNIEYNKKHLDTIFLSTSTIAPLFHGTRLSNRTDSHPVIIEFEIPDKKLLVQDYDSEHHTGILDNTRYIHRNPTKKAISNKPLGLSKELGMYGYLGNIPPKFIKYVWVPINIHKQNFNENDFKRLNPSEAIEALHIFSP